MIKPLAKKGMSKLAFRSTAWKFSEEQERKFAEIFEREDLSDEKAYTLLVREIFKAQSENSARPTRFLMRAPLRDIYGRKSLYALTRGRLIALTFGPHYNPVFNRVASTYRPEDDSDLGRVIAGTLAIHEGAHAFDRNRRPIFTTLGTLGLVWDFKNVLIKTPITPLVRYRMETEAVGAQWELVRRLPKDVKGRLIVKLRSELNSFPVAFMSAIRDRVEETTAEVIKLQRQYLNESRQFLETSESEAAIKIREDENLMKDLREAFERADALKEKERLGEKSLDFIFSTFPGDLSEQLKKIREQHDEVDFMDKRLRDAHAQLSKERQSWSRSRRWREDIRGALYKITLDSLINSELSKEDFIRKQLPTHGYDQDSLLKYHYRFSQKDALLLYIALFTISSNTATQNMMLTLDPSARTEVYVESFSPDIRLMQSIQAFLIDPTAEMLTPVMEDDNWLSDWADGYFGDVENRWRETHP